jgi:hypothetical protein
LPAVDAAQALADLVEISSQIECAVLAQQDGTVLGSTLADGERSQTIAREGLELLKEAAGPAGEPAQVQAALAEGSVFLVRDGARFVVAVTGRDPTAGLVFYDLKSCLRLAAEDTEAEAEVTASSPRRKKEDEAPPSAEEETGGEA